MATPNIVPKSDGEGALGRDGRAWASVQAHLMSSPVFKLLTPTPDQLTSAQGDASSLYLSGGSLFNGQVEIATKTQVDTLQATINAFFGSDANSGLTNISEFASRFDASKDTLLEILDAIDTFATTASVNDLGVQINALNSTVSGLGTQINGLNSTVTSIGDTQNDHATRIATLESTPTITEELHDITASQMSGTIITVTPEATADSSSDRRVSLFVNGLEIHPKHLTITVGSGSTSIDTANPYYTIDPATDDILVSIR